jgi:CheY-like chemotaxis protein
MANKGNLLIIDNDVELLETIAIIVHDLADVVYTAENGEEALKVLKDNEVNCIVCDINMPVMNGIELLKILREKKVDIPFILYTGYGDQALRGEVKQHEPFAFIDKPDLDGLTTQVVAGLSYSQK